MDEALGGKAQIFLHVQVVGRASSVLLLESNALICAAFALILFSIHIQVSLFLWLSSRLATSSASGGSKSSFTRLLVYSKQLVVCLSSLASIYLFQFRAILLREFMQTMYAQCHKGLVSDLH